MYKHLFGPVPSRRLGMSLGIDLVPHKVCTLNCIYCECGATTSLTLDRKEYVPFDKVAEELSKYFENNPKPDYITFSGSGEPTLNSRIGDISAFIKDKFPGTPLAVLTNGTLLDRPEVRQAILAADVVLPSLDAVSDRIFRKINRPNHNLKVENHIDGLVKFREEFSGKIWLEIFIVPGLNNTAEELAKFAEAVKKIRPDSVQLNSLDRPGAVEGLRAATHEELQAAAAAIGFANTEIVSHAAKRKESHAYRGDKETAILETLARRPCTAADIADVTGLHANDVNKYLGALESEGKIEQAGRERGIFYRIVH